ncbi:nucleotide-diphospho-sugar transferase [Panus rudis PR-1116 ss-1]|nr:nucleotide-diphospho-sugar transferase [Panus rudis PR-1116 ss-1]
MPSFAKHMRGLSRIVELKHHKYDVLIAVPITSTYKKTYNLRHVVLFAGLIALAIANFVVLVKAFRREPPPGPPYNPLDHYQFLNRNPLIDSAAPSLSLTTPQHEGEYAVVTALYTDAFAPAVATLGHSLQKVQTSAKLLMFYIPGQISPSALCLATSSGFTPRPMRRIPPPNDGKDVHEHFLDQFTKLGVWTLDQEGIKSVVYLDADTLVSKNFDELFTLPFNFGAVPDVYLDDKAFTLGFNAGVLFLRTSTKTFDNMIAKLEMAKFPHWEAEQSYLNHFFGAEAVRLPYAYNGNLAIKRRARKLWNGTQMNRRIIHFTLVKPFLNETYGVVPFDELEERIEEVAEHWDGDFREEVWWWGDMFQEMKNTYGERIRYCRTEMDPDEYLWKRPNVTIATTSVRGWWH